jgi:hypothetical protein
MSDSLLARAPELERALSGLEHVDPPLPRPRRSPTYQRALSFTARSINWGRPRLKGVYVHQWECGSASSDRRSDPSTSQAVLGRRRRRQTHSRLRSFRTERGKGTLQPSGTPGRGLGERDARRSSRASVAGHCKVESIPISGIDPEAGPMLSICLVVLMPPGSYARPLLDSKKLTSRQLVDEAPALIESSPKSKEVIVECQLSVGSPGLAGSSWRHQSVHRCDLAWPR